ncbi:histidinol-phosphatase [Roseospira marina]|uniref:Histidinol-phosphatase n=1 Tax=Roseospira marina TaxID=140057 RepID=A0A5M6IF72_9PROT|nr:histidinol-phosphatase [Roseospira marina]KAA5606936.1 histidinol-phosphatase [Roseospira marina]MBB4312890.1 histidinol phosphatase-like enzyme (inositol monophosphatase family) [Roseospira marina]MBB5086337.1 histidinol phosphatase-like enzyme (inositol monophosphatase family) [Roseospira marina]
MSTVTDLPTAEIQALLPLATRLADAAREATMAHFRSPALAVETKGDLSPVTVADRASEAAMRALLAEHCPDHGILGEEEGASGLDRDFVWVLDPIDGTRSYVTGSPLWGTLIALSWRGRPVLGVLDTPAAGERWIGCVGQPTTRNGTPCRTRDPGDLSRALLYTSTPDLFTDVDRPGFEALSARVADRRFCADCFAYGMVASGWVDIALDPGMKPYDYMALVPVIEGAGGVVTDSTGAPASLTCNGWIVSAGTPAIHAAALEALAGG